ncbi:MAG: hypothetical protein IPP72_09390 [Chitinophagaceae bacterium]|nr:hypothetical protein [Chitinophagaceae bacterium]
MECRPKGQADKPLGYIQKLLIYPHAVRDVNAYYSPDRKALLFGYFNATPSDVDLHMPGSLVFSCLSHDIIAHETTHAILDGIFRHYMEPTHPDVGAFHEGFADIVALFQHFTFPEAIKNQLAKTRGSFNAENLLGQLAVEFGKAYGNYHALRDAIGKEDEDTGEWKPRKPDVNTIKTDFEPHDRGSILVAVIFDAFINIYNHRTADLLRIATNGTGILPQGRLNTDLVNRLADEAAKTAMHVLSMCIRALDYCPPVDINFGDYLRALVTADADLVKDDDRNYRIAFIDAFRKWGIYPEDISMLSEETLIYSVDNLSKEVSTFNKAIGGFLRVYKNSIGYENDREAIFEKTNSFITGRQKDGSKTKGLHEYLFGTTVLNKNNNLVFEKLTGLVFSDNYKKMHIKTSEAYKSGPSLEIHSIRLNNRVGPDGNLQNEAIITLAQRCGVKVVHDEANDLYDIKTFTPNGTKENEEEGCFIFRGGCTLIFDLNTDELKHVISKPIFDTEKNSRRRSVYVPNNKRAIMQYRSSWGDYAALTGFVKTIEPFAHIHQIKTDYNG